MNPPPLHNNQPPPSHNDDDDEDDDEDDEDNDEDSDEDEDEDKDDDIDDDEVEPRRALPPHKTTTAMTTTMARTRTRIDRLGWASGRCRGRYINTFCMRLSYHKSCPRRVRHPNKTQVASPMMCG